MSILKDLEPSLVWSYFEEICAIPRLSKNEGKIRRYLIHFAEKNNLSSKEDNVGNILIIKPASPGMENRKTLVLQSHQDMVGEIRPGKVHNWDVDPITPEINNGWVSAQGTTLGADDGMGIALQLAILSDINLIAGKIECLFTVDEETGMTGAFNLEPDFFTGKILLNLDSEDEGVLYIGCAGGMNTVGTIKLKTSPTGKEKTAFKISISGLHGGHSGDEIHKGYANAIKIMNRLLIDLSDNFNISVSSFIGGNLPNAIPREAVSVIVSDISLSEKIKERVYLFSSIIKKEFKVTENDIEIVISNTLLPSTVVDKSGADRLFNCISCCPHGAIAWSKDMNDLVETSSNLAIIEFNDECTVRIVTTQRSSVESSKRDIADITERCMKAANAEVTHSAGYPGWKPDMSSPILGITMKSYRKLFGFEPQIRAIHAGLECGIINKKVEGIDMISFGPSIKGAHTTEEKIEIATVSMFWSLLLDVISNIPAVDSN